jgi:hypothetical protein
LLFFLQDILKNQVKPLDFLVQQFVEMTGYRRVAAWIQFNLLNQLENEVFRFYSGVGHRDLSDRRI